MAVLFCNKLALRSSLTYRPLYLHCWVCVSLGSVGKMANYKEHEPMEEKSYQKISKETLTLQSMLLVLWIPNRFTAPMKRGKKKKNTRPFKEQFSKQLMKCLKSTKREASEMHLDGMVEITTDHRKFIVKHGQTWYDVDICHTPSCSTEQPTSRNRKTEVIFTVCRLP